MTSTADKKHTRSLSRWHLIANRIAAIAEAKQREAMGALGATHLQHAPTASQKSELLARGKRALELVDEALQARRVVGEIRSALAAKNAEVGVSQLLADIEAKRKEAGFLREVTGIDLLTRVSLDEVGAVLEKRTGADTERAAYLMSGRQSGVAVALVAHKELDAFRERLAVLDADINTLTDKVNDKNRADLTLTIPDAFAAMAGLNG